MNEMRIEPKSQNPKSERFVSLVNTPWKISLVSIVISNIITVVMTWLLDGLMVVGLAISTVCAASVGYVVGAVVLNYRRRVEIQNLALRQMNAELEAFARTVAHDLKAPLGAVMGYADMLEEMIDELEREKILHMLKEIRRSSDTMAQIIEALLLLAHIRNHEVELEVVDMNQVMRLTQQRLGAMLDEYRAEVIQPDRWPRVLGYAPWIEEVWVNYLSNGLKYGGSPPCLEVGATTLATSGDIRFWVKDNGPGIDLQDQPLLFTEFSRLHKKRAEGHGLGLSIVQRIIEKLGGRVGVESTPGQGSTFYFTLKGVE